MTIRLLRQFEAYPANSVVSLDVATEAALVSQVAATYSLAGGVPFGNNEPFNIESAAARTTAVEQFGANPIANAVTNAAAIQAAVNQGGKVSLMTPGAYEIGAATFAVPSSPVRLDVGPGVVFTNNGAPYIPSTLPVTKANTFAGRKPQRVLIIGDSFAQRSNIASPISNATVNNGVMGVQTTGAHGFYTGMRITIAGAALRSQRVKLGTITRLSANSFSIPAPDAPNGPVAVLPAARSGMLAISEQCSEEGLFCHLSRVSGGGYVNAINVGCPGFTIPEIASLWDELVGPYIGSVDAVIFEGGYNSIAQSDTVAQITAAYNTIIAKTPIPLYVCNIFPVVSGTSADTPAKLQVLLGANRALRSLCDASPNAKLVDIFSSTVNPATGYAQTSMILGGADNIHPSPMGSWTLANLLVAQLVETAQPRPLVTSTFDNVATDSTNPNIARNGLVLTTSGGSTGGLTAAIPADETTGIAAGAGASWAAGSVSLASGEIFVKPASNGIGNAQCGRFVADAAGDQGRLSLSLTAADIVIGGRYDLSFRVRVNTQYNASNRTPSGQNMRALNTQFVMTVDGVTFTYTGSNPAPVAAAGTYINADFTAVVVIPNILIAPGAAITLGRIDAIAHFDGAGSVQLEMSQVAFERIA